MGQFLPPDHSKGDERTIGGYQAVHARPAAFEGSDGLSYSVEIDVDATEDAAAPFAAFLVFVRWSAGEPRVTGHVETDYLVRGVSPAEASARLGAMPLEEAKRILDAEIAARSAGA
ncbi:MAG TPA: hypothetical protein VMT93_10230 [Gemmatimonadaceae bacterium]|nr:hypothetical protein [Gemmatimonadaceae bacterium]